MTDKKIIGNVLESINGGTLLQKVIEDLNAGKRRFQTKKTLLSFSVAITAFIDGDILRSHYFGKKGASVESTLRSITKGDNLAKAPESIFQSMFVTPTISTEKSLGGAIRSNGIIISTAGLNDEIENEYVSWLILNSVERRLNETNKTLGDNRYYDIENKYVKKEKARLEKIA